MRAPTTLDRGTRVKFRREDLGRTTRVDSAGLGVLVLVRERAAERRWTVCLRGASEELRFMLVLTRLENRFEFEPPVA